MQAEKKLYDCSIIALHYAIDCNCILCFDCTDVISHGVELAGNEVLWKLCK